MNKLKELFSNKKFLIFSIITTTILIVVTFLALIYVKDKPAFLPEETRGEIREIIKNDVGTPIEKVVPVVGKRIIEAAYVAPVVNADLYEGWLVFHDQGLGIKLKYPASWETFDEQGAIKVFGKRGTESELAALKKQFIDTDVPIFADRVIFLTSVDASGIKQYSESILSDNNTGSIISNYLKGSNESYLVIDSGPNRFGGGVGYHLVFSKGSNLYELSLATINAAEDSEIVSDFFRIINSIE